jgi:2-haloacid dehalogenase
LVVNRKSIQIFGCQTSASTRAQHPVRGMIDRRRDPSGVNAPSLKVTEDALVFVTNMLKLELSLEKRQHLMQAYLELKSYPDALPALKSLQEAGIRLAFLSNLTPHMLDSAIKSSGLEGIFELSLSTDRVRVYKPDPRAYQMGIDAFNLRREEILFAAFGGWDAAAAKLFGYPTFWVNRLNLPMEELGVAPDATGQNLTDLVDFVKARQQL